MQCEVCGRQIYDAPIRAIIENAKMTVCPKCEKLCSGYWEPKPQPKIKKSKPFQPIQPFKKRKRPVMVSETLELINNLPQLVRKSREKMGMSHEDLGKKTREKVSVLRKIESGKMVPDLSLAEKLEHTLKIKLRVPTKDPEAQISTSSKPNATTLGDLIKFKVKKEGAKK
ncbi:TIGR00270 family protein [Candidatus Bathyarchaeota archaeon]|nr:TIGR00270 family protein [Candidatus Bathyarchaeota archaeon]